MSKRSEVVLAVDDDPAVLALTATRLRRAGFTVLEASGAEDGLLALESRDDVSVIVSDCTMPGMRGSEMAQIVLAFWPHIKFIVTSGRPPASDLPQGVAFIAKPYRAEVLIATIDDLLATG